MPSYKLYYFNARGRGELPRLIFAAAGVKYDDIRFTQEDWPKQKPNTPFGSVPFLDVDGKPLAQSRAIARYLANEFGLAGSDSFEKAKVDEAAECVLDIAHDFYTAMFATDAEKAMSEFVTKTWPSHQAKVEKIFDRNPAKGPKYLVGEKLTFADLALLSAVDAVRSLPGITLTKDTEEHVKKVSEVPNVAKWLKNRPQTQF